MKIGLDIKNKNSFIDKLIKECDNSILPKNKTQIWKAEILHLKAICLIEKF